LTRKLFVMIAIGGLLTFPATAQTHPALNEGSTPQASNTGSTTQTHATQISPAADQKISVLTGLNEMDHYSWVRVELTADTSYVSATGVTTHPNVQIQCSGLANKLSVMFYTGLIQTDSDVRIKVGNLKPLYMLYAELGDRGTLVYGGVRQQRFIGDWQNADGATFAAALAVSSPVLLEFHPFLSSSTVVARYDTSGLLPELVKHEECKSELLKLRKKD